MPATVERLRVAFQGRYRLDGVLGDGPMGSVYLAEDLIRSGTVALKVVKPEIAALVAASRFLADLEKTRDLRHPGIPLLIDCGEVEGILFYVVPRLDGESLRERLDRVTRFPVSEAVSIASAVAEALDYAHGLGFLHGDLKPANILFDQGAPMLSSFGVLRALGKGGARLSEADLALGTPYYMSPERAVGVKGDSQASETYALGCILYEMLVGAPPFVGATAHAVLGEAVLSKPVPPRRRRAQVPANIDAAVRRALEKRATDRFASCAEFAEALADPRFTHKDAPTATVIALNSAAGTTRSPNLAHGVNITFAAQASPGGADDAGSSTKGAEDAQDGFGTMRYADRLLVKEDESIRFINVHDIRFIESERNYVRIHTDASEFLVRRRIGVIESQLDPSRFRRIHRSTIVNLDSVDRLVPWFSGGYLVHLVSGEELKLSRGYANKLFDQVGKTL